ncbi:MAG: UMP kinase [Deltaproteobacteria bacterium]|nr:UMP kinase [Deltaproteobacteria bacterium]
MTLRYKRILLKLSGEVLAGQKGYGIDPAALASLALSVRDTCLAGSQVGLVIGGGNIQRGTDAKITGDRVNADYMGMLATLINALALKDALKELDIEGCVMSGLDVPKIAETFVRESALEHLENGRVVIFAGGTGSPFFTTDTAAALRALEIGAEVLIKATKVNGVYDKDPVKFSDAKFLGEIDYDEVLRLNIKVMDSTAISLCRENNLEIRVININDPQNLQNILHGHNVGSTVRARRRA